VGRCAQGAGGLKIRVLSVGRDRSGWFEPGVQGYAARLRHYTQLELVELPASRGAQSPELARRREAETLKKRLLPGESLVALDEGGAPVDSVAFSRLLGEARDTGRALAFVLGGDEGLDPSVRGRAWKVLSLSPMTFPHRLARLVLLEQLYRGFTLLRGEPYHK
jgi:23S rRNA (pseudouridine1915-N3)-methyltransferase